MKKLMIALLVAAVAMISTPAFAFDLGGYLGPITMKFSGLTRSEDNIQATGVNGETWGIVALTDIYKTGVPGPTGKLWSAGQDNEQIYALLYGMTDNGDPIVNSSEGVTVNLQGGHYVMYISNDPAHTNEFLFDTPTVYRTGLDEYHTITDIAGATLFLSGDFGAGILNGDAVTTISQDVTFATTPSTGSGKGYAEVLGGAYADVFNTGTFVDGSGNAHDLFLDFTLSNPAPSLARTIRNAAGEIIVLNEEGWDGAIEDPLLANIIPEPTSMLLLGAGLFGLVGFRRKK